MTTPIVRHIRYILGIILACMAMMPAGATAQEIEELDRTSVKEVMTLVENHQTPWERIELSGKLKCDLLPLSPSIKIFMEKGKRIDLSIRAPFLGEVGRLQADTDTIFLINKHRKIFWSASMSEVSEKYPGGIELLQSILLGRTVIFGEGPAGTDMGAMLSIYPDDEDGWLLMPKDKYQVAGARYGYVVGADGETLSLIVERENSDDYIQIDYDWKNNSKYNLLLQLALGSKEIEATLQFDAPRENALPMNPIAIDRKYRRVDIKEFLSKII